MKEDIALDYPLELEAVAEMDYETERNKPMPNRLHGTLQNRIGSILNVEYGDRYEFPTEVSLEMRPGTTPDICVYPIKAFFDPFDTPAKEPEMPLTTIEIISPSQSFDEIVRKIRKSYFPSGIQSAWLVVPTLKGIHLFLPDRHDLYFNSGMLTDPATGIQISVDKIFERVI
ncbi:MAG: Uma2 family endonuclease [Saprospiraceae bacterium]